MCTLTGSYSAKYLLFDLKKSTEELSFMTLKKDAKFEEKLTYGLKKWNEEFGKFLPERSKVTKLGL